jgi:predicted homoserine dehydrogenase-like protein
MSYVSRLRERERHVGRPVRVGLVGAGQMGRGLAAQLGRIPGMALAAAFDVDADRARAACVASGAERVETDPSRAAEAVAAGVAVALDDAAQATDLGLDAVVDATGVPDVGARIAQRCLLGGIDFITLNVETDVTVGRYLGALADASGAVYSVADGDEPVSAKELVDFAYDLGFDVVCAGKGKNNPFDPAATPDSVSATADTRHMNPKMLASFVDGSKTMIEMAALANATGFVPDVIGMHGPTAQVDELSGVLRPVADGGLLSAPGRVDYAFGPAPGVFVIVTGDDAIVSEQMTYLSMGNGPYWCLYRPYHLASLEAPRSVARAVLDRRSSLRPVTWSAEVVAVAKRDLTPGERIDGIGGHTVRGLTYPATAATGLLPLGLAQGCEVIEPIARDEPIPTSSVAPAGNTIEMLRRLQDELFPTTRRSDAAA